MKVASEEQDYERAARLRDDIRALERAVERSAVVLGDGTDADVVAIAEDPLEAAVHVFYVRGGRVRGQRGWVADRTEELDTAGLVEQFLQQLYGGESGEAVPREVLVPVEPTGPRGARDLARRAARRPGATSGRRSAATSARCSRRSSATRSRRSCCTRPVERATSRPAAPRCRSSRRSSSCARRRCGSSATTSRTTRATRPSRRWSCSRTGSPRKGEYRRFKIRTVGSDDVGAMTEVISRRFRRWIDERSDSDVPDLGDVPEASTTRRPTTLPEVPAGIDPDTGRPRRFAYRPQLVVVDGARPQAEAARRALDALGIDDVAVVGLAKRLEEVWLPGRGRPGDPAAHQRGALPAAAGARRGPPVRDHLPPAAPLEGRSSRASSTTVAGLGPTRKKALLKHFGSVKRLRAATVEEVAEVPGHRPDDRRGRGRRAGRRTRSDARREHRDGGGA